MRFVIINFAFHNQLDVGSHRWREMGAILAREHDVTAICGDAPQGTVQAPMILDGVKVIRRDTFRTPKVGAGGFLKTKPNRWLQMKPIRFLKDVFLFPDTYRPWAEGAVRIMQQLAADSSDTVVVTSSPVVCSHVAMLRWRAKTSKPPFWVMDMQDPWTTNPVSVWPRKWPRFLHEYEVSVERKCHHAAGLVTVIGERMREMTQAAFSSDPVVVYNGYSEIARNPQNEMASSQTPAIIRYFGKVIPGLNNPDLLFAAAKSLGLGPDALRFEFWCNDPQTIINCAAAHGVGPLVSCYDRVPREECLRMGGNASANLILNGPMPDANHILTGKLFELVSLNRPIIAVTSKISELRQILENCGCRLSVWDAQTASEALKAIVSHQTPPPFDKDRAYSREKCVKMFLDALIPRFKKWNKRTS